MSIRIAGDRGFSLQKSKRKTFSVMLLKLKFVVLAVTVCIFLMAPAIHVAAKKQLFGTIQPVVVIDPGHGGDDTGATGPDGSPEKVITLNFARILAAELDRGYKVVLTRTTDSMLDLEKRTSLANYPRGDLFISIHTSASYNHGTTGIRIYWYQKFAEDSLTRSDPPPTRQRNRVPRYCGLRHRTGFAKTACPWPTTLEAVSMICMKRVIFDCKEHRFWFYRGPTCQLF